MDAQPANLLPGSGVPAGVAPTTGVQEQTGHMCNTHVGRLPNLHGRQVENPPLAHSRNQRYPLIKAHFRVNGTLVIPGTSLKGCIRSIVEAISPSSVSITRAPQLLFRLRASDRPKHLDVTQRIFGALGYQGQIRISDAALDGGQTTIQGTPQLFRPRPEAPNLSGRTQAVKRAQILHARQTGVWQPAAGSMPGREHVYLLPGFREPDARRTGADPDRTGSRRASMVS